MSKKKRTLKIEITTSHALILLLVALIAIYSINIYTTSSFNFSIGQKVAEQREQSRPADIHVTSIVDSTCSNCFDMGNLINFLKSNNASIKSTKSLEFSSVEAKKLISDYDISSVPALVITGEVKKSNIVSVWRALNAKSIGDAILLQSYPPYRDLNTNEVKGLVELINIVDNSCSDCYNVSNHKSVLPQFGIVVVKESTYDINSDTGKSLLGKYNITKVPTILLSSDANVYQGLNQIWPQVGTIGSDGWYIFRTTEVMGDYKDLDTGKVVQTA